MSLTSQKQTFYANLAGKGHAEMCRVHGTSAKYDWGKVGVCSR